jgi:hypothetical protein
MPSKKKEDDTYAQNYDDDRNEKKTRMRKRRYYPTRIGGRCVNAQTGQSYPCNQGSYYEMQLYKSMDCTGFHDANGYIRDTRDPVNKEPLMLFYDTPEEWSRHHKATLNPHLAGWWRARKAASFPDGVFNRDAYLEFMKNNPRTPPVQHEATEEDFQEEW